MSLLPDPEDTDLSVDEEAPQQTADVEMGEEAMSEISASEMRGFMEDASADEDEASQSLCIGVFDCLCRCVAKKMTRRRLWRVCVVVRLDELN